MRLGLSAYVRERVHGFHDDLEALRGAISRLCSLDAAARPRHFPGVSADRAAVLPAGLLILEVFLSLLGVGAFTVSPRGLRAGLIEAMRTGDLTPRCIFPPERTERNSHETTHS
jgi:exopolyphosphatase/pppGpp-phosphohydrolase